MKTVSEILNELESDNGRLFKIEVLEQNLDNKLFERVLTATLDPTIQYYIRKVPEYTTDSAKSKQTLEWALDELGKLSSREFTGHAGRDHLADILTNLSDDDADVITRVIAGDLKCGVNKSTVNKVYGNDFIKTYPVMLASTMSEKSLSNITFPAIAQIKLDGMRANIIMNPNGDVEVKTRNGKHVELFGRFDETVKEIFYSAPDAGDVDSFRGAVLDGELLVLKKDGTTLLDRKTGNGILNKAIKGTISKAEADRVVLIAWDLIPIEFFHSGGMAPIPYAERMEVLSTRIRERNENYEEDELKLIRIVPTYPVADLQETESLFEHITLNGQEGIILKNFEGLWEDKRSKDQIKMKMELEADLLVTGWNEGAGQIEGLLGSVTCVDANGNLEVNVGSGFTLDERKQYTSEQMVGKIISVKYNEVIQDKNKDKKSLFLPIFLELREDKDVADKF
jgi:ATP-dependent DNA ligase